MKLYVIRHGEVDVNVKGLINSHNDSKLTEKGVEQARKAGKIIKNLDIDLIFCSPIARAVETCNYINLNKIDVIYDKRLVERDSKSMQYRPIEELDFDLWYDRTKEILYKDAEGFKSVLSRVTDFLEELKKNYNDKNVLIVTHGDICKAIYVYFNPTVLDKDIYKYSKGNCEIAEFDLM